MHSVWTETTVAVASAHAEAVASFLLDLGSPGLVTDDVATEESASTVTLTAYFGADAAVELAALHTFCEELAVSAPDLPRAHVRSRPLRQQDWAHNWMEHFPPLAIGERMYVVPPWVTEIPPGRFALVIDPGLAFGTGHHATTQGCLTLLEQHMQAAPVYRALDVGTGSGILAIALARLGVPEVWAIDTDPLARRAAAENCARNGVTEQVQISAELSAASGCFGLIVANLLSSLFVELAPTLAGALAPAGHLIASGVLVNEAGVVAEAFATQHLAEHRRIASGEWLTLDLTPARS